MAKKLLRGDELAEFIKKRQLRQARNLRQEYKIIPKLVIIKSVNAGDVINTYVRMKQRYAADIAVETEVISCSQNDMPAAIARANHDAAVQGIIVQLPLDDPAQTEEIVNQIAPQKDVDGLGEKADFVSATAEAIDWLLAGYNVELGGKKIAIFGQGKLVGAPLMKMWQQRGFDVTPLSRSTENNDEILRASDVIVSATGVAGILTNENVPQKAVVVDAGTVSEDGKIVGDAAEELQIRQDLTITPPKGGVGPLTIVLLFEHVIQASYKQAGVATETGV